MFETNERNDIQASTMDIRDEIKNRILSYQAPFLEEKLLMEGIFDSHDEYQETFIEFKKYVSLLALGYKNVGMVSDKVDAVWHQFILFTRNYEAFCYEYLDGFLHHEPERTSQPTEVIHNNQFMKAYYSEFGSVKNIWVNLDTQQAAIQYSGDMTKCSGDITAVKCSGDMTKCSGDITAVKCSGDIAKCSGDITAVKCSGDIAKCSGDITAVKCSGDIAKCSGDITAVKCSGDIAKCSGDITAVKCSGDIANV